MAGDGSSTWMIAAPASTRAAISSRRIATNASAAATRSRYTSPGPVRSRPESVYGGRPGLAYLLTEFAAMMARRGLDEDVQRRLFVHNPARAFAFAEGERR